MGKLELDANYLGGSVYGDGSMERLLGNPYFCGGAGLSVGAGIMIVLLAKYGRKLLGITEGGAPNIMGPYSQFPCLHHSGIEEKLNNNERTLIRIETKVDKLLAHEKD